MPPPDSKIKPRIHFVALVSVDYDCDMLPYFIPHYDALALDNYCLFLHEGRNVDDNLWAEKAAKDAGWKVRFVVPQASFNNGSLKRVLLEKFQKACDPKDYIICADGDEIQEWEDDGPQDAAEAGVDIVLGRRTDRFGDALLPVDLTLPLEATYPLIHPNLSKILFPKRPRLRDKIVMSKASVPVDFKKCAGLTIEKPSNLKVTGEVPVLHYKWRDGILNRLSTRTDYTPDEIDAIKEFFEHEKGVPS